MNESIKAIRLQAGDTIARMDMNKDGEYTLLTPGKTLAARAAAGDVWKITATQIDYVCRSLRGIDITLDTGEVYRLSNRQGVLLVK